MVTLLAVLRSLQYRIILRSIFTFSSKSTVFANWDTFQRLYRMKISAWFYAQGFPDVVFQELWNFVLVQEWNNHEFALREDPFRLQQTHISKILQSLQKSLVFHFADHQASHLMIFCPQFYFKSVLRVWQDPSKFYPSSSVSRAMQDSDTWVYSWSPSTQVCMGYQC